MGFPWQDVSKSKQVKSLFFKSSLHYLHFEFYQRDGLESPQNLRQWLRDGRGCLGKIPVIQEFWALGVGVLGGCECKDWYLEEFHESCGQKGWMFLKTRSSYVLAILSPLFLVCLLPQAAEFAPVACLEVWTGNWSQFCMTHHIVLSDPATPPMCCACRMSQAMRQLLRHISCWYPFCFGGDVQMDFVGGEVMYAYIYMYIDTWRVLQSSNPTFWHSPILLSGNCAREIHSLSLDWRAMTLEFFFGGIWKRIQQYLSPRACIFCCFHY